MRRPTGENEEWVWSKFCDTLLRKAVSLWGVEGRKGLEEGRSLHKAALGLIKSDGWLKYGDIRRKIMEILKRTVHYMGEKMDRMRMRSERSDLWKLDLLQYYVHLYEFQGKEKAAYWARIDLANELKRKRLETTWLETEPVKRKKTEVDDLQDEEVEEGEEEEEEVTKATVGERKDELLEEDRMTGRQDEIVEEGEEEEDELLEEDMRNGNEEGKGGEEEKEGHIEKVDRPTRETIARIREIFLDSEEEEEVERGVDKEGEVENRMAGNDWREKLLEEKAGEEVWDKSLTREVFPRVREISDEEEAESERDEKGANRMGDADQRLKKQIARSREILSDSEEEEMEIRMSEGKKDGGGLKKEGQEYEDQTLENHIYLEHNYMRGLKIVDNMKAEAEDEELKVMEAAVVEKKRKKQRLEEIIRDWDEEEAKTELDTKANKIKIDNDTTGAETLLPWRFELIPEDEQWGKLEWPTTRKVELTSAMGRRCLSMRRRGCTMGVGASH